MITHFTEEETKVGEIKQLAQVNKTKVAAQNPFRFNRKAWDP